MERKPNESFEDYKARRAAANLVTKNINRKARSGGTTSTRAKLRRESKPKGTYGLNILAMFARQRVTPESLAKHAAHLKHAANRRAKRIAGALSTSDLIQPLAA